MKHDRKRAREGRGIRPPRAVLFRLQNFLHQPRLHIPQAIELLRHVRQVCIVDAAGTVGATRNLVEVVADAAQEPVCFFNRACVHFQKITVQRHFSDEGSAVIRMGFLHPLVNHLQLIPSDRHFDDDVVFLLFFLRHSSIA